MDAQVVEGTLDQRIAALAHADHGIVDRAGLHGRLPAQAGTRVTFSAWIFFWAPVRRARGSGASAPRSSSASR